MISRVLLLLLLLLLPLAACSPDPLLATRAVPFTVTLDRTKAVGATVCGDSISVKDNMDGTFELFLRDTREALGGGDPARISLDTIKLSAVEGPGDLPLARSFDTAAISLVIESTGRAVTVVTMDHPQVIPYEYPEFPASFDSHLQLTGGEWAAMLSTLFHVRMCAQATPDFLQQGYFYLRLRLAFSSYDR